MAEDRLVQINLGHSEVVDFNLDSLPEEGVFQDLIEMLPESSASVQVWLDCALELIRVGMLPQAEELAAKGAAVFGQTAQMSSIPPLILLLASQKLEKARQCPASSTVSNDNRSLYHNQATDLLQSISQMGPSTGPANEGIVTFLMRGLIDLHARPLQTQRSEKLFDDVLAKEPTNIVALMGKARILLTSKKISASLRMYQQVLKLRPESTSPDPRIGMGLCYLYLGHKDYAKKAWKRSLELNPKSNAAQLLLSLHSINEAKTALIGDDDSKWNNVSGLYDAGVKGLTKFFKESGYKSASAAIALANVWGLERGETEKGIKLIDIALQQADTDGLRTHAKLVLGRLLHAQGRIDDALKAFEGVVKDQENNLAGWVGTGVCQLKKGDMLLARHTFEKISSRFPDTPEVTAILASLLLRPNLGASDAEKKADLDKSRDFFDRICQAIDSGKGRKVGDDSQLWIEIGRAWQALDVQKAVKAYQQSAANSETKAPDIVNNLGVMAQLSGNYETAQSMYQDALTEIIGLNSDKVDGWKTTVLYNLGRVYEEQGMEDLAREAYSRLLQAHPEYQDAKARLAAMHMSHGRIDEASRLLKEALEPNDGNLEIRALTAYMLVNNAGISATQNKAVLDFTYTTLKKHDRRDVYSLCASAYVNYQLAREVKASRDTPEEHKLVAKERAKYYTQAIELYNKALSIDPECVYAAQGLAIAVAEDAFAIPTILGGPQVADEGKVRVENARQAISILQKVRECAPDGGVYINLGHCYFANDEYTKAIESYETALQRFFKGKDLTTMVYLSRAWYTRGNVEGNFSMMGVALRYTKNALDISPGDKSLHFNRAMIQQKAVEMLLVTPVDKRTLEELEDASQHALEAQKAFESLSKDQTPGLPYSREVAEQRFKYGQSIMRRLPDAKTSQSEFEESAKAKVQEAKIRRQEEQAKLAEKEAEHLESIRQQQAALAEERRHRREEVSTWIIAEPMDDYVPKKARDPSQKKRRKIKTEDGMEERSDIDDSAPPPKRAKKGKKQTRADPDGDDESTANESGAEGSGTETKKKSRSKSKPKHKRKKVIDPDGDEEMEEVAKPSKAKKNKFKSSEIIEDSDEEDETVVPKVSAAETVTEKDSASDTDAKENNGTTQEEKNFEENKEEDEEESDVSEDDE